MLRDVSNRTDIEEIVASFYDLVLKDPIVGFIFTDIAKIDLEHHLPIIVNFWCDSMLRENNYFGNPLKKHLEITEEMPLRPGHFTRWLYLFNKTIDERFAGNMAEQMKGKAEMVAKSFSAAITNQKRSNMNLTLPKATEIKF